MNEPACFILARLANDDQGSETVLVLVEKLSQSGPIELKGFPLGSSRESESASRNHFFRMEFVCVCLGIHLPLPEKGRGVAFWTQLSNR